MITVIDPQVSRLEARIKELEALNTKLEEEIYALKNSDKWDKEFSERN